MEIKTTCYFYSIFSFNAVFYSYIAADQLPAESSPHFLHVFQHSETLRTRSSTKER